MSNVTNETLELVKIAQAGQNIGDSLSKSITTADGLVAYDLQAPAKTLVPVFTPIRNKILRVSGGKGLATNWKVINSIVGSGYDTSGWVPEGQRTGRMSINVAPKAANYVTVGEEDSITFEGVHAGRGFADNRADMVMRLLQKVMQKEEHAILGGNGSLLLGTPATPTLSAAGTTSTLGTATYSVIVVALTHEGYYNSSLAGGVATVKTITGADGATFSLSGGSSQKSAAATQAITLGETLSASTTCISGAVAYAWFVGLSGSEKLEKITTLNSVTFTAPLTGGSRQAATAITADNSRNAGLAFDGLMTTCLDPANSAYVKQMATGNSGLTSSGRGSVTEIDAMLQDMWDRYMLSPTVIYANSQEIKAISDKVMSSGSSALIQYQSTGAANAPFAITAGGTVKAYFNPFMPGGGQAIPIMIHPKVPPGMILGWSETLPMYYQNNEISQVAQMLFRKDYYQVDWPIRTRAYETGVYAELTMAVYAPFAMGAITNIAA